MGQVLVILLVWYLQELLEGCCLQPFMRQWYQEPQTDWEHRTLKKSSRRFEDCRDTVRIMWTCFKVMLLVTSLPKYGTPFHEHPKKWMRRLQAEGKVLLEDA